MFDYIRFLSKKLVIGLICLCLFLNLTGCDHQISPDSTVIKLTLWQGINPPPNRDIFQKLVDRFNQEHPNIQVESLYIGQSDQQLPKILAAIVGNAPPDLLWFAPMLTGQLVELDGIVPIESFLNNSPLQAQIDPSLLTSMQFENHLWSIPFATNNVAVFYRPSLFQKAGIKDLPKTWAEFEQVARQLTIDRDQDGKIDQYGMLLPLGKGEWTVFTWLPFMWSANGEIVTKQGIDFNNPGVTAALKFWQDLIKNNLAVLSAPERGYELDKFLEGKVAMQLTGPWTLGQLESTQVDYDAFAIPYLNTPATVIGGENLFMMKTTQKRQEAVWKFMEYVLSEEFQTEWSMGTGYLPINQKVLLNSAYQKYLTKVPKTKVFLEQAKYGRSRPISPGYSRLSVQLGREIEAVLMGRPVLK